MCLSQKPKIVYPNNCKAFFTKGKNDVVALAVNLSELDILLYLYLCCSLKRLKGFMKAREGKSDVAYIAVCAYY